MYRYVSLLRGINVGGHKKIRMADLREVYAEAGYANVESYLQSGNVVFDANETDRARLAAQLEAAITQTLGHEVAIILRDGADLARVVANNPFLTGRTEDPAKLHVTFLAETPSATDLAELTVPDSGSDEFQIVGQEVYLFCPNGVGRTKLTNNLFERRLYTTATSRNWRTVTALCAMAWKG